MYQLYFVDDQTDMSPILRILFIRAGGKPDDELQEYVGSNQPVKHFMDKIKNDKQAADYHYLLDINMPVPMKLKTQQDIWPKKSLGEDHYCGIALAKWLNLKQNVPLNNIALITHWGSEEETHKEVLEELEIREGEVGYIEKHDLDHLLSQLTKWQRTSA